MLPQTLTQQLLYLQATEQDFQLSELDAYIGNDAWKLTHDERICEVYGERAYLLIRPEVIAVIFEGGNQWAQVQEVFIRVR